MKMMSLSLRRLHQSSSLLRSQIKRSLCCRPENTEKYCWKCGIACCQCTVLCMDCNTVQKLSDCDYFDMFHIKPNYDIDSNLLDHTFKKIQSKVHPDKYTLKTDNEKDISLESSSTVNQAYQTLKNPIHRAMYILSKKGFNVFDEGTSYNNPLLMSEIFSIREEIADITSAEDVEHMLQRLNRDILSVEKSLQRSFETEDLTTFSTDAVRLKYLSKALQETAAIKEQLLQGNKG